MKQLGEENRKELDEGKNDEVLLPAGESTQIESTR